MGPDGRGGAIGCFARGRRLPSLCLDRPCRHRPATENFCDSPGPRLAIAGIDPQPAFSRGHLRASDQAQRGGGTLMQDYLTLTRRELATYFVSLTGYITIAA